ncbi:DUF5011 domain-containing protein [Listeria booriae]|uniref:immunoglobulin-like domain-containing protein n=1 Tax=Listeria booriae TaxID=1552123 RepID=UPI00162789D5|nr:immunoglobulin-like domain-containing protein [Listeria booriae]MBC1890073.1 DUF5011 domain-containing protein [Listeria booriae]
MGIQFASHLKTKIIVGCCTVCLLGGGVTVAILANQDEAKSPVVEKERPVVSPGKSAKKPTRNDPLEQALGKNSDVGNENGGSLQQAATYFQTPDLLHALATATLHQEEKETQRQLAKEIVTVAVAKSSDPMVRPMISDTVNKPDIAPIPTVPSVPEIPVAPIIPEKPIIPEEPNQPEPPTPEIPEVITEAHLTVRSEITLHAGQTFQVLDYASAVDENGADISSAIKMDGIVDTNTPGIYTIMVQVSNGKATANQPMTIHVINDKPVFSNVEDATIFVNNLFDPLANVQAMDTEDGDISSQIQVVGEVDTTTPGDYELVYTVTDRHGGETYHIRVVHVVAESPVFSGVEDITIEQGTVFDPREGVEAIDAYGSYEFSVTGDVDINMVGVYTLTYEAVNAYQQKTKIERQVEVAATETPVEPEPEITE